MASDAENKLRKRFAKAFNREELRMQMSSTVMVQQIVLNFKEVGIELTQEDQPAVNALVREISKLKHPRFPNLDPVEIKDVTINKQGEAVIRFK